jgi:putative Ca2+/H+ antiporter (TMEM165/GDT1 family)
MFLTGAVILFRQGRSHHVESGEEYATQAGDASGLQAVGASFLVLFAAEWGDLSQLLTLTLVARYEDPVSVFAGALGALLAVSGLAVLLGRALLRVVPLHTLHYVGAGVCVLLAGFTAYELVAG